MATHCQFHTPQINVCGAFCYRYVYSPEDAKKIYDKRVRNINSNITLWDVYVALNAQYHDNIVLYEKWFGNISEDEMKEKNH